MNMVCLDLEGVLVPEIWIAFAEATLIPELRRTTRDESDYDKLMKFRLGILDEHHLKLSDIHKVIAGIEPLPGAVQFAAELRAKTQLVILSDTFSQFAAPLMAQLSYPTLLCNELTVAEDGRISGYTLRQKNGKREAVKAFQSINVRVFAAGDSYNDIAMIDEARKGGGGCLFRAPEKIKTERSDLTIVNTYDDLMKQIDTFLTGHTECM